LPVNLELAVEQIEPVNGDACGLAWAKPRRGHQHDQGIETLGNVLAQGCELLGAQG
jgi:hypothetical protein